MGFLGGPGLPNRTPSPPAAHPPTMGSTQIALTSLEARQRARAAEGKGFSHTVKTSMQGVDPPSAKAPATLLGD